MQLKLTNINKIKEATINLNGLTVIAGQNDSGKSTVGKVLFSVIKAVGNVENYNEEQRLRKIMARVNMLYAQSNRIDETNGSQLIGRLFRISPKEFISELLAPTSGKILLDAKKEEVNAVDYLTPQQKARIWRRLEALDELLSESNNPQDILKKELQDLIEAEFLNCICTDGTTHSKICFSEGEQDNHLEVTFENNKIKTVSISEPIPMQIMDATYVESPLYIHLLDILSTAQTLKEGNRASSLMIRPLVNYHVKDIAQKLDAIKYVSHQQPSGRETSVDIGSITGGRFEFDSKARNIYWQKGTVRYSPVNVASGIKAFGVMQILMETQAINENKILIWDEPENHLHPEWQIKFARILVEVAQTGVPILVSSHSPYFIQGIRYFAEKLKLEKFVNYYLTEDTKEGLSVLEDVTKDLNRVFVKLAQPMNEIINMGM